MIVATALGIARDPDALFCALVLAPESLPRNRFFSIFAERGAARARSRARLVRALVRQLAGGHREIEVLSEQRGEEGALALRYRVPSLGLVRTALLLPLEAAVLRYALERALGDASPLRASSGDRDAVLHALARAHLDGPRAGAPEAVSPR